MDLWSRLRRLSSAPRGGAGRLALQVAAFALPAAAVILAFRGGPQGQIECGGPDVHEEILGLFRRQLKLTPYARFIDVAKADVTIEAVFDVAAQSGSRSCVAFATYHAALNEAGRQVKGRERLRFSLLYELSGEKQVFYTVRLTGSGRSVRVGRISG